MCLTSCEQGLFDTRPSEGTVTFDVTYPYMTKKGLMASMMPNSMELKFKGNNYSSDLTAGMGLFRMGFISDNNDRRLKNFLKIGPQKMAVELDEQHTLQYLEEFPELTIIKTPGIDTIAGFRCKEAIAIYNDASKPDMTLYYTDEIKMTQPNWCNQFNEIDGVLLAYEIDRYDIRMRFRATSFSEDKIEATEFNIPEDFNMVTASVLEKEIEETLRTFDF